MRVICVCFVYILLYICWDAFWLDNYSYIHTYVSCVAFIIRHLKKKKRVPVYGTIFLPPPPIFTVEPHRLIIICVVHLFCRCAIFFFVLLCELQVKKRFLISGGGAAETEVAMQLTEWAKTQTGMRGYCIRAYGEGEVFST